MTPKERRRRDRSFAKPSSTPIEVTMFKREGITHLAYKQSHAACVGGIDNWWLESYCGQRVVVTSFAPKLDATSLVDCMVCIAQSL